jgi:benzoylformate decarboxylase
MYSIQALWSAANLKLPMTFVILKNGRYEALIRFGRYFGMQSLVGARFPEIDFVSVAEGLGVPARRVATPEALEPSLREAVASRGPCLVEVTIE